MTAGSCARCGAQPTPAGEACRDCGHGKLPDEGTGMRVTPAPASLVTLLPPGEPDEPSGAVVTAAPSWWLRPGHRGQLLVGTSVTLAVILALAGYVTMVSLNNARNPPDKPVKEFFAALSARDGALAAQLANCTTWPCATVLSEGYDPPTDVQIIATSYTGAGRRDTSVASVRVAYRLPSGAQTADIRVQRSGNLLSRPFHIVTGATAQVAITAAHVTTIRLGPVMVPTTARTRQALTVLPGTYSAQVTDDDPLFASAAGPVRFDVTAPADDKVLPIEVAVPVQVREDVVTDVRHDMQTLITGCVEQDVLHPPGCPFEVPGIVIGARNVEWQIVQMPVVDVVPADEPTPGVGTASVRTVTPGQVAVTYTAYTSAAGDRQTVHRRLPVEVQGSVTIDPVDTSRVISLS